MANYEDDFKTFWGKYPRRIAKIAAMKAYAKARKSATAEEIMAGLERYIETMPADPQYRPYASTWLNQGRWLDEAPTRTTKPTTDDWYAECGTLHNHECGLDRYRHCLRLLKDTIKL